MLRQLRHLVLAASAAAVLGLISVVPSALALGMHGETEPTYLFGEQSTQVTLKAGSVPVKCKTANMTGTIPGKSVESLTLSPSFSGCTIAGQAATITGSGIHAVNTNLTSTLWIFSHAEKTHLVDTNNNHLVVKATTSGCTITYGAQTPTGIVEFEENGSGATRDSLVSYELSGMTYTSSGGICGTAGTRSDGTWTGSYTLKGFSNEAHTKQVGIWLE